MSHTWDHSWPKARKQHQCEACLNPIDKGEKYFYCNGIYDGAHWSLKLCNFCARLNLDDDVQEHDHFDFNVAFEEWKKDFLERHGVYEEVYFAELLEALELSLRSVNKSDRQRHRHACNVVYYAKRFGVEIPRKATEFIEYYRAERQKLREATQC